MLFPQTGFALRILIPERLMNVHAAQYENVRPAIAIKIIHEAEHGISWAWLGGKRLRRVELVLVREPWPLVPERPGDNVWLAVAIDVARGDAVAEILIGEDLFL